MSENNTNPTAEIEDISSTSTESNSKKNLLKTYCNGIYKNLDVVVKTIAFVLAFMVIIMGLIAAFLLVSKTAFSIALAFVTIIVFTIVAACVFFPLFSIGHILSLNNEILKQINKD